MRVATSFSPERHQPARLFIYFGSIASLLGLIWAAFESLTVRLVGLFCPAKREAAFESLALAAMRIVLIPRRTLRTPICGSRRKECKS
jgi:hypothetical protein